MKRVLLVCVVLTAATAGLPAYGQGQDPYAGTSNPPQDDIVVTSGTQPIPKPSAGKPLVRPSESPATTRPRQQSSGYVGRSGTDENIVERSPESSYQDPEASVYQPIEQSNRYNPAPVVRNQAAQPRSNSAPQANGYQSAQPDPYYQEPADSQNQPAQNNRYQSSQNDPYYQDAPVRTQQPAQTNRYQQQPAQNSHYQQQPAQNNPSQQQQNNRYQSQQADPYYQDAPSTSYRPAQQQQQNRGSQSAQQDPYYQQAPTQMYRPSQANRSTHQQVNPNSQSQQPDPYYQGSQATSAYQNQQNGSNYVSGQVDPYQQDNRNNSGYQQPNSYNQYQSSSPSLTRRPPSVADPDGDIVHPVALGPQQLAEGTTIRVHLLGRISSATAANGDHFRTRVVNDVVQNGRVLIPADSEIDGRIYDISRGHVGSGGYMHLRPETVILRNGTRFKLYAQVTGAPGANAKVGTEGTIKAGSRMKRNGVEYGSAMGVGAGTGAYLGGPVGALAGTAIGAGVITIHLMASHSQATLENGTPLQFTLTQRLSLVSASPYGE